MLMTKFLDRIGMSASILCGIHCLLTPILVLAAPALGNLFSHHAFHWIIALVVFPVAAIALWMGYRLHRYPQMLYLGGAGLFFMLIGISAGAINESNLETGTMIVAGLFLTWAHFLNLRACEAAHLKAVAEAQALNPQPPPHGHSSSTMELRKERGIQEPESV